MLLLEPIVTQVIWRLNGEKMTAIRFYAVQMIVGMKCNELRNCRGHSISIQKLYIPFKK